MTEPEWRAFLSHGTRTAKLATTRADGRPHVAPVWFVLDGDDLVLNTGRGTVKGRTLARDPRVMVCVDDEEPPFSFALVEGTATLSDDLADVRAWAGRIAARYMGEERAEEYAARNGVPGELVVRVRIEKVVAQRDLAA
jgi:PPOX class probable F420-dependent enzyme